MFHGTLFQAETVFRETIIFVKTISWQERENQLTKIQVWHC